MLLSSLDYWRDSLLYLFTTANLDSLHGTIKGANNGVLTLLYYFLLLLKNEHDQPTPLQYMQRRCIIAKEMKAETCVIGSSCARGSLSSNKPPSRICLGWAAVVINWHGLNVNSGADPRSLELQWISSYENRSDKLVKAPFSAEHNVFAWQDNSVRHWQSC